MQTFDQSIFGLFQQELVSYEEALRWASNVDEFKLKVQGISTTADMAATRWPRGAGRRRLGDHPIGGRCHARYGDSDGDSDDGTSRQTAWTLMADDADRAYVAGLTLLARRELAEAQVRTAARQAEIRRGRHRRRRGTPAPRTRDRRSPHGARLRADRGAPQASRPRARRAPDRSARASRATSRATRSPKCSRRSTRRAARAGARPPPPHGMSLNDPAVFRRVHRYLLGQGFDPGPRH